ncbi:EipB family protein [Enhydrobacter aerosaccus]|nr:DUF1849 family protein [Enhydrobacter aerosaccus]
MCLIAAMLLVLPHAVSAQMQPHRAEYALRLGTSANAPRIGTAFQDITLDCTGWHIKRDISSEIAITSAWKLSLASKLDGEEARSGNGFRYRAVQIQNGAERDTKGKIQRSGKDLRAEIVSPTGPSQFILPPPTLMPVAAISHLVDRLKAKAAAFPALMFDAEVVGDAFLVDVTELEPGSLRPAPPADSPVAVPSSQSWPVFMTFTRGREQEQRPLFSVSAKVFDSGVLDRLTVDTGLLKVTADLQSLEMHKAPTCPGS